jgi:hypothetical protein
VVAAFDGGTVTSDAGGLLLREVEKATGLIERFSECFVDRRDPRRIEHSVREMVAQRIYGVCLGYEDLNDHDTLRKDPFLATLVGKLDPSGGARKRARDRGAALAGKSTLNRLELTRADATEHERYCKVVCRAEAVERFFVERFLEAHTKEPERIWLDLDLTDIPLHGEQEERFFHGYYDQYCYLPLYIFSGHFLLCAKLRPANIDSAEGLVEVLAPILDHIRQRWKSVQIVLRADSGFCRDELMSFVEKRKDAGEKLDYLFGIAKNSRLLAHLPQLMAQAKAEYLQTGHAARRFVEFSYQTLESWSRARRIIGKAEYLAKGENPRFIVTSLPQELFEARALYEHDYCGRGDMENRIKEQQLCLFADRTSSSKFFANQLRLWFCAVAYVLMNELRRVALRATALAEAQCSSIRLKLLKIGARVRLSVRQVRLFLSSAYPGAELFATALQNLRLAFPALRL